MKFASRFLIALIILSISGCASIGNNGCGLFSRKGEIIITKAPPDNQGYCHVQMIYTNTDTRRETPRISTTFYDGEGNTLTESTFIFAGIESDRSQTIHNNVNCNHQNIIEARVNNAYDSGACSRSTCLSICGVDGSIYRFKK